MKKWLIWLLTCVMAFAFLGLLILQVQYIATILKTSNEQFDSTVRRSLERIARDLEQEEARKYLEEYNNSQGGDFIFKNAPNVQNTDKMMMEIRNHFYSEVKRDSTGKIEGMERITSYEIQ